MFPVGKRLFSGLPHERERCISTSNPNLKNRPSGYSPDELSPLSRGEKKADAAEHPEGIPPRRLTY